MDRIFQHLKERKITQAALARAIGVSPGNVTDWKSGKSKPSLIAAQKTADFLV